MSQAYVLLFVIMLGGGLSAVGAGVVAIGIQRLLATDQAGKACRDDGRWHGELR